MLNQRHSLFGSDVSKNGWTFNSRRLKCLQALAPTIDLGTATIGTETIGTATIHPLPNFFNSYHAAPYER